VITNDESEIIETTIEPPSRRLIDTILSNLLPTPPSVPEYEIAKSDMIEIEVPIIGSEFISRKIDDSNSKVVENHTTEDSVEVAEVKEVNGSDDIKKMSVNTFEFKHQKDQPLTSSHFHNNVHHAELMTENQDKINDQTTQATTTVTTTEVMEIFNKQKIPALIDDEGRLYALKKRSSLKLSTPVAVKIYVNNVDEKKSCKTKSTCNQVSFSEKTKAERERERDIDLQYYTEYSDEDLNFTDLQSSNGLRSRNAKRAAFPDDQILPITPAPRFSPILPGIQPLPLPTFKKPPIIERLETESSVERSERINKDLDNVMRFVSVWAHVDKFVSERARTAIRKLAYLSDGGDYSDGGSLLGSSRRTKATNKNIDDDPFT
jgi:hypothetical protein